MKDTVKDTVKDTMKDTLEQIKLRKSMRLFEDREISQDVRDAILEAAFEAPTAGAMMLYSIIDVREQAKKDRLAVTCDNQPFIAKAPMVLVFLADYQRWYDLYSCTGCQPRKPEEGDLLLAFADALIAAQNTVVAAEALGLGSCYIGDIIENCEAVRELLGLPEYAVPAAMAVYGYPTEAGRKRRKPARFDREYIVHGDSYSRLSPDELAEMYRKRDIKEGRALKEVEEEVKAVCQRKYMSAFALEMSRSAREYLRNFRKI